MPSFTVSVAKDKKINGLGLKKFKETPRIGEFIELGDTDTHCFYKVIMVVHAEDNLSPNLAAGDIFLMEIGKREKFFNLLFSV